MAETKQTGHGPTDRKAAANAALAKTKAGPNRIRVRATRTGYYDHIRRREGDVFDLKPVTGVKLGTTKNERGRTIVTREAYTLTPDQQFSEVWMEEVHPSTPLGVSTSQDEIRRQHDEILALKAPARTRNIGDEDPAGAELGEGAAATTGTGDQDPLGAGNQ